MNINKHLNWEPSFRNEINIEEKCFTITIKKDEVEIDCIWDYGYGGRGSESMCIPLAKFKELIAELEQSHTPAE